MSSVSIIDDGGCDCDRATKFILAVLPTKSSFNSLSRLLANAPRGYLLFCFTATAVAAVVDVVVLQTIQHVRKVSDYIYVGK